MKLPNKRDLIAAFERSAEELHERINVHQYLVTAILEQRTADERVKSLFLPSHYFNERRLKEGIREAIEVLEQSRKAFKSKRLEALRKKLTRVLIESE